MYHAVKLVCFRLPVFRACVKTMFGVYKGVSSSSCLWKFRLPFSSFSTRKFRLPLGASLLFAFICYQSYQMILGFDSCSFPLWPVFPKFLASGRYSFASFALLSLQVSSCLFFASFVLLSPAGFCVGFGKNISLGSTGSFVSQFCSGVSPP